jgi:hypothetical protein
MNNRCENCIHWDGFDSVDPENLDDTEPTFYDCEQLVEVISILPATDSVPYVDIDGIIGELSIQTPHTFSCSKFETE